MSNRRWINRHDAIVRSFVQALQSRPALQAELEPLVSSKADLHADFKAIIGNSWFFYDVQVVATSKDSARADPWATLQEAYDAKLRKYRILGGYIKPLILSTGGLMAKESAKSYKQLQEIVGPSVAYQLDVAVGLTLTKQRAYAASSIAVGPQEPAVAAAPPNRRPSRDNQSRQASRRPPPTTPSNDS